MFPILAELNHLLLSLVKTLAYAVPAAFGLCMVIAMWRDK